MRGIPSKEELRDIVDEFQRESATGKGLEKFHAAVAANTLALIEREVEQGAAADAAELDRLRKLLDSETGSLEALNQRLANGIQADQLTAETAGLIDHLWRTALAEVAIDQPNYATYKDLVSKP